MKLSARMMAFRREGNGTFVLRMLFAIFALAVGLSCFGNVDLWKIVSNVDIHMDISDHPTAVV